MKVLRMLTAGESHGPGLIGVLEGIPANMPLDVAGINFDLKRRQGGFGRGGRQAIESDEIEFFGGLRGGVTLGSPLAFLIKNRDYANWQEYMDPIKPPKTGSSATKPRPGHADLAGALKYGFTDIRPIIERSSARETAVRTAIGSICAQLLAKFGIIIHSHVIQICQVRLASSNYQIKALKLADKSPVRCIDPTIAKQMEAEIKKAQSEADTLGGVFEVIITGIPPGLGSYIQWDHKLDARLSYALMAIQGIKGVEIGAGFAAASTMGSELHDPIFYCEKSGFYRGSNNAGGIEGGISNGEEVVIRAVMKPIPTLRKPLPTVDLTTKEPAQAHVERSDTCAVPAASVVGELVCATVIADAFLEVYGQDNFAKMVSQWNK